MNTIMKFFMILILVLICFASSLALQNRISTSISRSSRSLLRMSSKSPWSFLSPNKEKPSKTAPKISAAGESAISVYKKRYQGLNDGKSDEEIALNFNNLADILKDETKALEAVKVYPDVLSIPPQKCTDNFGVFEGKWGFEKTKGLILRNPSILGVATTGYGSAETAGDDTLYASYLISITRPIGGPLLALLFLALLKPFVAPFLFQ